MTRITTTEYRSGISSGPRSRRDEKKQPESGVADSALTGLANTIADG